MESIDVGASLAQRAFLVAVQISLPVLLVGWAVGACVSLFQAVTQIQDQTLSFLPKILAMGGALFLLMPWLLSVLTDCLRQAIEALARGGAL